VYIAYTTCTCNAIQKFSIKFRVTPQDSRSNTKKNNYLSGISYEGQRRPYSISAAHAAGGGGAHSLQGPQTSGNILRRYMIGPQQMPEIAVYLQNGTR